MKIFINTENGTVVKKSVFLEGVLSTQTFFPPVFFGKDEKGEDVIVENPVFVVETGFYDGESFSVGTEGVSVDICRAAKLYNKIANNTFDTRLLVYEDGVRNKNVIVARRGTW